MLRRWKDIQTGSSSSFPSILAFLLLLHGEVAATASLQVIPTGSPSFSNRPQSYSISCLLATMELSSSGNLLAEAECGSSLDGVLAKGFLRFGGGFSPSRLFSSSHALPFTLPKPNGSCLQKSGRYCTHGRNTLGEPCQLTCYTIRKEQVSALNAPA